MSCSANAVLCLSLLLCFLFLPSNINNVIVAKYISDSGKDHRLTFNNFNDNLNWKFLWPSSGIDTNSAATQYISSAETWSAYQSLSGVIRSNTDAEVVRNADGRLEVFVVLADNQLYHKWQTSPGSSSTWSAYQSLGGIVKDTTDPVAISNSDGRLEVFVVGTNVQLYHKWQTSPGSSTWSAYHSLGGVIRDDSNAAGVVRNADGRLEVFVVLADNQLYHKWQTSPGSSSTWSSYQSLGGVIKSNTDPKVVRNADGRLEVFVVGTNDQLYHKWQTSPGINAWSAYQSLGGIVKDNTDPVAISNSDGRLEVFVEGTNNGLWQKWQTSPGSSSSWSSYQSLGGVIRSNTDAEVVRNADGRLEVFVVGTNSGLWHKWQTSPGSSSNWSSYQSLGGIVKDNTDPVGISNSDGKLEVFVVGTDNALWHKWHITSRGILPAIKDPNLTVERFVSGLSSPTSATFLDSNNILVLEKNGNVRLVSNGQLQTQPILQIPVNTQSERGLLGVASTGSDVFLYFTIPVGSDIRNRIYKYDWNGQSLVNPVLLLDLPGTPGPNHDGGKLMIGPDNFLYAVIGDLNRNGKLQNFANGPDPDDSSVILKVNPANGSPAPGNPLSSDPSNPLSSYYAYGIRNSFGIDFDPVNNRVWETENGPNMFDEINLVDPGFNSGWEKVMGPIALSSSTLADLVNFPGSHYRDPSLNWRQPIGITDLEFLASTYLGPSYQNNLFVGDINNGNLYFLTLNAARSGFILNNAGLSDLIVDNSQELDSIVLGAGFSGITDILTGPDGMLYVLSYSNGEIYRITSSPY